MGCGAEAAGSEAGIVCGRGREEDEIRKRPARKPAPTAAAIKAVGHCRAKSSTSSANMPSERLRIRSANCVISSAAPSAYCPTIVDRFWSSVRAERRSISPKEAISLAARLRCSSKNDDAPSRTAPISSVPISLASSTARLPSGWPRDMRWEVPEEAPTEALGLVPLPCESEPEVNCLGSAIAPPPPAQIGRKSTGNLCLDERSARYRGSRREGHRPLSRRAISASRAPVSSLVHRQR